MNARQAREEVKAFGMSDAPDTAIEDCFPAWFLKHTYGISGVQAKMQSSDPALVGKTKGDAGLDAYHLETLGDGKFKIVLLQAKYTDSTQQIAKGFKDLERCLPRVENILKGVASPELENKIYVNLRAAVQQRLKNPANDSGLDFELKVIHLSDQDQMIISANCRRVIEDLKEAFRTRFPEAQCTVELIGPPQMNGINIVRPGDDWFPIRLSAVPLDATFEEQPVKMYLGVGHLLIPAKVMF